MKSASIYIPMRNEKNEDYNDWKANLCTDAQAARDKTYIRLVIFTNKEKIPTAILWGDVYAAGSLLEEPFGIAVSGDSFCIKMILHCSKNANIRL